MTRFAPAIHPETNDIYIDTSNNLAVARDAEAVGQHVRQRLKTFSGEWFLDTDCGVRWLQEIMGGKFDPALAEALIKSEVMSSDSVTEINEFSVDFDLVPRRLKIYNIHVTTTFDEGVQI